MALPFQIFDFDAVLEGGYYWANHLWCIRCNAWIPVDVPRAGSGSHDPHVEDHRIAWMLMEKIGKEIPHEPSLL